MSPPPPPPPLPSPPFIPAAGLANLRDIGGYPFSSSLPGGGGTSPSPSTTKIIRPGILFRAAEPSKLTDEEGVAVLLQRLNITKVFDLRSAVEIDRAKGKGHEGWQQQPREWAGAERVFAPVFLDADYSPEALAVRFRDYSRGTEGFVRAYTAILSAAVSAANPFQPFRTILTHLASVAPTNTSTTTTINHPPSPILIHCTAGKDRTGVLAALVLSLCGVADEVVAHEYSLSDLGLAERKEESVAYLMRDTRFGMDREGALRMVGATKENMLATLELIRQKYGSVERYVTEHCGITPEQVEQIRRNMVVDLGAPGTEGGMVVDWRRHAEMVAQGGEACVAPELA